MTYKVVCRKCGTELEVKDLKKYLGKDKDDYVEPITCPKCLKELTWYPKHNGEEFSCARPSLK